MNGTSACGFFLLLGVPFLPEPVHTLSEFGQKLFTPQANRLNKLITNCTDVDFNVFGNLRFAFLIEEYFINEKTFILWQGLKCFPQRLQLFLMNKPVRDVRLNTDDKVIDVNTIFMGPPQRQLILPDFNQRIA